MTEEREQMTKEQADEARALFNAPEVQETLSEADQMEIERLKSNSDIQNIISDSKKAIDTININGVEIRFQSFISRPKRRQLSKVTTLKSDTIESAEEVIYNTLALMCLDDPYNKPLTWKYIEAQGGDASEYLAKIMTKIKARAAQMRSFQ